MSDVAVQLTDVGKRYRLYARPAARIIDALGGAPLLRAIGQPPRDLWAVRNLSFTVCKGERVALIGRNGAGKSTTLKMLIRAVQPTEGRIDVNGRVHALMEIGTGFHPEFTGRENIKVSLSFHGILAHEARRLEPEIIDFSELAEFIDQPVKTYSAGMYARLAFATATAILPSILVIDEVLGAGDAYFAGKCLERMRELTERAGTTLLFVSHDASAVQTLCERAIWIDRGLVRNDGPVLPLLKAYGAQVRADEELRLRARDSRARQSGTTLERQSDAVVPLRVVFHHEAHPTSSSLRVSKIIAKYGSESIGELYIGAALDNDRTKQTFIDELAPAGTWGPPITSHNEPCRVLRDGGSAVLLLPRHVVAPQSGWFGPGVAPAVTLEITAAPQGLGTWRVFAALGDAAPSLLGSLQSKAGITTLAWNSPPILTPLAAAEPQAEHSVDQYGVGDCIIRRVLFADDVSLDTKLLHADRRCTIKVDIDAFRDIADPVVVFCAYQPNGTCAMQLVANGGEHGLPSLRGSTRVEFVLDPLYLGIGEYVASVAVFKHPPRLSIEPEAFHVLDRCIHFKITDDGGPARVERGVCRQPFRIQTHEL